MHAVKKAARREAYFQNDAEGTSSPTLWGRLNARPHGRRAAEPEDGLRHTSTGSNLILPLDLGRRHHSLDSVEHEIELTRAWTFPHRPHQSKSRAKGKAENSRHAANTDSRNGGSGTDPTEAGQNSKTARERWMKAARIVGPITRMQVARRKPKLPPLYQLKVVFGSPVCVGFVFVPAGFAVNYTHQNAATIFVVNFFAIIPFSATLSYAIDQLALYIGDTLGGLLTITFSNAVQLISSIFLLKSRQIRVLQSSLLGVILQNVLLMTGCAMLCGGVFRSEQNFNATVAKTMGMFLLLAVLSLTIPTVSQLWGHSTERGILSQSRGTAIVIMFSYVLWLIFQLGTHRSLFKETSQRTPRRPIRKRVEVDAIRAVVVTGAQGASIGSAISPAMLPRDENVVEQEEIPQLSRVGALLTIVVSTVMLAFHTEFATNSIRGILAGHKLSERFVGIVILPLLSNDLNTIAVGVKDKMDLSLALTVHRSMQTALMVAPLVVLIAWGMNIDSMTLDFDGFSVAALFASIIILTYVIQEGKSNWLTGALLIKVFIIVGLASFFVDSKAIDQLS